MWLSSDAWKSKYGKFSLISLTVHFLDDDWNYRAVPVGACSFNGRHINKQVWNHIVTMLLECGILQVGGDHFFFNPDINVDEYEIVAQEILHKYTLEHI